MNILPVKIKGIIQVGAHDGQELDKFLSITDTLALFEPLTDPFNHLSKRVGSLQNKDNIKLFNLALGEVDKISKMFIDTNNGGCSSSFMKPKGHLSRWVGVQFSDTTIDVQIKKLDDLGLDVNQYNTIYMDVQGYELSVLRGATNFLKYIDYIFSEWNDFEMYEGCPKLNDLREFVGDYGFDYGVVFTYGHSDYGDVLFSKHQIDFNPFE